MTEKKSPARGKVASSFQFDSKDKDLPATQGMLHLVRTELKSEMRAGFKQVDARFNQIESRFNQIDSKFSQVDSKFSQVDSKFSQIESRFSQIDSRFNQVDSRLHQMDSKLEQVLSEVARIGLLVEEQNSRNSVVLEGLSALWQRQERVETRVDEVERLVRSVAGARS